MIEDALVFALGALAAGLLALVLFPAFTRRAARLARRDAEARLPKSLAEIAALRDAVRAEYAVKTARVEADLRQARKTLIEERLARAEEQTDLYALRSEKRAFAAAIEDAERRVDEARAELRAREEALTRAAAERRDLDRRLAAEAERGREAQDRAEEATRLATEIRVALVAAEARVAALSDALRASQAERDAVEARYATAEEMLGRRTAELAAATDGHGSRAALEGAMEDLLEERKRLIGEASRLRRERDVAREALTAAGGRADPSPSAAVSAPPARVSETPPPPVPAVAPKRKARPAARSAAPPVRPPTREDADEFGVAPALVGPAPPKSVPAKPAPPKPAVPAPVADAADEEPLPAALAAFRFPPISVPATSVSDTAVDPAEQARRVDDLARRLKQLRVRNASARGRHETSSAEEGEEEAAADARPAAGGSE